MFIFKDKKTEQYDSIYLAFHKANSLLIERSLVRKFLLTETLGTPCFDIANNNRCCCITTDHKVRSLKYIEDKPKDFNIRNFMDIFEIFLNFEKIPPLHNDKDIKELSLKIFQFFNATECSLFTKLITYKDEDKDNVVINKSHKDECINIALSKCKVDDLTPAKILCNIEFLHKIRESKNFEPFTQASILLTGLFGNYKYEDNYIPIFCSKFIDKNVAYIFPEPEFVGCFAVDSLLLSTKDKKNEQFIYESAAMFLDSEHIIKLTTQE